MGRILDSENETMATIGQDGYVMNTQDVRIGKVRDNGEVVAKSGRKVGSYDGEGNVYEGGRKIGEVRKDGRVYAGDRYMGKTVGDHIMGGGAALLLLVR